MHELNHLTGVNQGDHVIIELVYDVCANKHSLDVVLHYHGIVGLRVNILGQLDDILLLHIMVLHQECIAHGALRERLLSYFDGRINLRFLKEWLLPIDLDTLVLDDVPGVADGLKLLVGLKLHIQWLDLQVQHLLLVLLLLIVFLSVALDPVSLFNLLYLSQCLLFIDLLILIFCLLNNFKLLSSTSTDFGSGTN
jgi:hypothetical protein